MKKSLIIIATAALVFAGCTENDTFRKDINGNGANNGAITFNSFTEKATKAENSNARYTQAFYTHQESFQVWARKSNQPKQEIFGGTKVKVEEGTTSGTYTYEYAPERFWDKLAEKYHFYAAAPARTTTDAWKWTFNGNGITTDATLNAGYFTIAEDFTLNEVNLKHVDNGGADNALENVFKNVPVANNNDATDIDLLIAAPTEVTNSYYNVANPDAVNLNFIHILSKLNVTIKTSLGTVTPTDGSADHTYEVKLLAFEVKNVPNVGTFTENPNNLATNDKKQIRWTLTTPATNNTKILTGIAGLNDQDQITTDALPVPYNPTDAQKKYIVESLFIPQQIKYERVALDGEEHDAVAAVAAVPFSSYTEYTTANRTRLTEDQFNELVIDGTNGKEFVTLASYRAITGYESTTQAQFDELIKDVTKTPAVAAIAKYEEPSEPYFTIKYSIDGEIFTANYNLAAAFLKYNNNSQKWDTNGDLQDLVTTDPTTFDFYEGWQNTLNITINPTAITFTADVAEWADNANVDYDIDKGNESPNN